MYHSRDIDALRADVAENCRRLIALAGAEGLPVRVTETVRDGEYQRYLAENGYAAKTARTPSFHGVQAGLAFDFCKDVAGHAYDDAAFFARVGEIGKKMGFTWGGDWKSFPDRPHLQWDDHGRFTGAMVRAGKYPPPMPEYEEDEMTQEQFNAMMESYLGELAGRAPGAWSEEARTWAEETGLIVGDGTGGKQYCSFVTREQLAVILRRMAQQDAER